MSNHKECVNNSTARELKVEPRRDQTKSNKEIDSSTLRRLSLINFLPLRQPLDKIIPNFQRSIVVVIVLWFSAWPALPTSIASAFSQANRKQTTHKNNTCNFIALSAVCQQEFRRFTETMKRRSRKKRFLVWFLAAWISRPAWPAIAWFEEQKNAQAWVR